MSSRTDTPARISIAITSSTPRLHGSTAASSSSSGGGAPQRSVHVALQLHSVAVGLEGLLKLAAAVLQQQHQQQRSKHQNQQQRPQDQQHSTTAASQTSRTAGGLRLQLELQDCDVLACSRSPWGTAGGAAQQPDCGLRQPSRQPPWQDGGQSIPLAEAESASPGVVADPAPAACCNALLRLPSVSVVIPAAEEAAADGVMSMRSEPAPATGAGLPAQAVGAAAAAVITAPPLLVVQGLALWLPTTTGSGTLTPVLSMPVLTLKSQQSQQPTAMPSALPRCVLHVPTIGVSLRPPQLNQLVSLVASHHEQWTGWMMISGLSGSAAPPARPQSHGELQQHCHQLCQQQQAQML
jgi:hypothetical protein